MVVEIVCIEDEGLVKTEVGGGVWNIGEEGKEL
jgi:hypothetical protein